MLALNLINRSFVKTCRCAPIAFNYNIRKCSNQSAAMKELQDNYEPIYRFPQIRTAAAVNKIKNYQAIVTILCAPVAYNYFPEYILEFAYTGGAFLVALSLVSNFIKNSIGAVYMNKTDKEKVRIAYIDFFGRRRDSEFKIDDIVPINDSKSKFSFTKVYFANDHPTLKFISTKATVLDSYEFSRVFGDE